MFISCVSSYTPQQIISNAHFNQVNGLTEEWILSRTGIRERRKAGPDENTHTLGLEATRRAIQNLPFPASEIDLIVGATYTPYDTIHTLAHAVQHFLDISDIPVISLSTACSSFVNALEVAQGYFAMGKAQKVLLVMADHNTAHSDEKDKVAGHLWGDGASAMIVCKERQRESDLEVRDIITGGAGNIGKAPEGVYLRPTNEGFRMNYGKDVFQNACFYMTKVTRNILAKNGFNPGDISYFIPHQANLRISKNVAQGLELTENQALSNIEYLGNTGCAGCTIAFHENMDRFQKGDIIVITVFGGGYSYGSALIVA